MPKNRETDDLELQVLREINRRSWAGRLAGYASISGPGWIQGALTLGAATATSSFYLGWKFGYEMLWVNVLGMLMGVIMFAAISRPALYRDLPMYQAMRRHVHPGLAMAWAAGAGIASAFWAVNQYSVATACLADIVELTGWVGSPEGLLRIKWIFGLGILVLSIPLTWTYEDSKRTGVRAYERVLKLIIAMMILCLAAVAFKTGIRWKELFLGFIPSTFPTSPDDRTMVLGALGCAVGINMTFLYPVSLQARGWSREHLGLTRFDLVGGMLLPFVAASSLVIVTTANTLFGSLSRPDDPAAVARVMTPLFEGTWLPDVTGRILFDLGIAAMPLSTITILMLISGLALSEILGKPHSGFWFRLGTLIPAVGVLGVAYGTPFWLGPLISSFALIFLPIAYLGYLLLCNSRDYQGKDLPPTGRRWLWNAAMAAVLAVAVMGALVKLEDSLGALFGF